MTVDPVKSLSNGAPEFCVNFQTLICRDEAVRSQAKAKGLSIYRDFAGHYYLVNFDHFARQWRYAHGFENIVFNSSSNISDDIACRYSPLIKLSWAISALEQYCKLYDGKRWFDFLNSMFCSAPETVCAELRVKIRGSAAKKIIYSLDRKLAQRWDQFMNGEDALLVAMGVAIRNAYSHGEVWGAKELSQVLPPVTEYILSTIKEDALRELENFQQLCR